MRYNKAEESNEESDKGEEEILSALQGKENRNIPIVGEIDEEKLTEIMMYINLLAGDIFEEPPEDPKPMNLYVSTYGGSADDMFAIYDMVCKAKERTTVRTIAMGKVMSAGLLVMASGTRGERYVGRNCRLMLHNVVSGGTGELPALENEVKEIKRMQQAYSNALLQETNLTSAQLKRFFNRKVNVYLNAEEAVKHGFADKIL
jgi:ATP-dependent Clp protease protease subunit